MGFRVEIDEIKEADIIGLTTGNELLAKALADYANEQAAEAQRTNQQIIADTASSAQSVASVALANQTQTIVTTAGHIGLSSIVAEEGTNRIVELIVAQKVNALVPYTATINGVVTQVNTQTVLAVLPQKTIKIEYKFDLGASVVSKIARALARRVITHGLYHLVRSATDEDNDRATVLRFILDQLQANSPRLTGTYSESFRLTGDGQEIEPEEATDDMQEFVFVNMTPYARKIEGGLSQQAPEGVFEGVAAIAAHEFGDVADIAFEWREPPPEVPTRLNRTPAITVVFR